MIKKTLFATFLILLAAMLQATLFFRLSIYYAVPDICLIILLFVSYTGGKLSGELTGFAGGIILDMISLSPLGLNILVRTIIGFAAGALKGLLFLDKVFLPILLCALGTFLKAGLLFVLNFLFLNAINAYNFSEPRFWLELASNIVLAPFIFAFLNLFKGILVAERTQAGE